MRTLRLIFFGALLIASCRPAGGESETAVSLAPEGASLTPAATLAAPPSSAASPVPTFTPAPSPTSTPPAVTTAIPGLVPIAGEEGFAFSLLRKVGVENDALGVFFIGMDDAEIRPIGGPGLILRGLSADGQRMLVEEGRELSVFSVGGGAKVLLTDGFLSNADHGAYWIRGQDSIIYIASGEEGNAIYVADPEGTQVQRVTPADINPVDLFPSGDEERVYWAAGECYPSGDCITESVGWSMLDGSEHLTLPEGVHDPVGSPNGDYVAYVMIDSEGRDGFYVSNLEGSEPRLFNAYGDPFISYAWHPDADRLALAAAQRWDYTGQLVDYQYYFAYPDDLSVIRISYLDTPSTFMSWSPNGRHLLILGTEEFGGGFRATIRAVDFEVGAIIRLDGAAELASADYVFIPCVSWVR